jgi:hypothetical protein
VLKDVATTDDDHNGKNGNDSCASDCSCCPCPCEECQEALKEQQGRTRSDDEVMVATSTSRPYGKRSILPRMSAPAAAIDWESDSDMENDFLLGLAAASSSNYSASSNRKRKAAEAWSSDEDTGSHHGFTISSTVPPLTKSMPGTPLERVHMRTSEKHSRGRRRNSMSLNDMSLLIHDTSHPPSACASPSHTMFLFSPSLTANEGHHGSMTSLELEPAAVLIEESTLADGNNGYGNAVMTRATLAPPAPRKRRRSSVLGPLPNMDKLLESFKW